MTQSQLANKLNLTRQVISHYELGENFHDVFDLVMITDTFGVSVDDLINAGKSSWGESLILGSIVRGREDVTAERFSDLTGIAPLLKPSVLDRLALSFCRRGNIHLLYCEFSRILK